MTDDVSNSAAPFGATEILHALRDDRSGAALARLFDAGLDPNAQVELPRRPPVLLADLALIHASPTVLRLILRRGGRCASGTQLLSHALLMETPSVISAAIDAGVAEEVAKLEGTVARRCVEDIFTGLPKGRAYVKAARALLDAGLPPTAAVSRFGQYAPLDLALQAGTPLALLEELVARGCDPDAPADENFFPRLPRAATDPIDPLGMVRTLLALGASPLTKNAWDATVLHTLAASHKMRPFKSLVRLLLDAGAPLEARMVGGATPLIVAAGDGRPQMLSALVSAGASLDAVDDEGRTALHHAAETVVSAGRRGKARGIAGALDRVRILMAAGASTSVSDLKGRRPVDLLSARLSHQEILDLVAGVR